MTLAPAEQLPSAFNFWDKAQHALGFAALAFLGLMAYPHRIWRVVLGLVLFGVAIECAQAMTGWRTGDGQDWLADCVGVGLGYLVWRTKTKLS